MAQGGEPRASQMRRFVWSLNNMPVNVNISAIPGRRPPSLGLARVVQGLLPTLERAYNGGDSGSAQPVLAAQEPSAQGSHQGHPHHIHPNAGVPHGAAAGHHGHMAPANVVLPNPAGSDGFGESFVIDVDNDASLVNESGASDIPLDTVPDENQNTGGGGGQPNGAHGHMHNNGNRQSVNLANLQIWKWLEQSLPFLFFMFAKIMYNHRLGILVTLGLFGTFYHANSSLKKHIAQRVSQERRHWGDSAGCMIWIVGFLTCNIFFIYYVFEDQQLYRSLIMQLPTVDHVDLWTLLWIVGITDFVIKFGVIVLKALVALIPRPLLAYKKRGKYYMMLEHLYQFYRSIVPITPWLSFLQDDEYGGPWFSLILLILYLVCKGQMLWNRAKEIRRAFKKFQVDVSYGCVPSREELKEADGCPICQDKFTDPVKLTCNHIFCEDCVSMWFDRERTCPMCRANIVDNPVWRDGSTSPDLQLY